MADETINLMELIDNGHMDVIKMLNDNNVIQTFPNFSTGNSAHIDILKSMVDKQVVLKPTIKLLVEKRLFGLIQLLLEKHLIKDINARINVHGQSLLSLAADNSSVKIIELLIEQKADPNIFSIYGNNALMVAACFGNPEIVDSLIKHGSKLDGQNNQGNTALINAVKNKNTKCVQLLLDAGANINLKNLDGLDALGIAKKSRYDDIIKIIEEHQIKNATTVNIDVNGKQYPKLVPRSICHAIYCVKSGGTAPETYSVDIPDGCIKANVWRTNKWCTECIKLENYSIQLSKNSKIEYHVMVVDNVELYVKFPTDLKIASGDLGDVYS